MRLAVDAIELHAHHAIQLATGFDGPAHFRPNSGAGRHSITRGPWYAPGALHKFRAPGQRIVNILFEPETPLGRALLERHGGEAIVPLDEQVSDLSAAFDGRADDEVLAQLSVALIARPAGTSQPQRTTDQRVIETINWISGHIDRLFRSSKPPRWQGLAKVAFGICSSGDRSSVPSLCALDAPQSGTGDGVQRKFLDWQHTLPISPSRRT